MEVVAKIRRTLLRCQAVINIRKGCFDPKNAEANAPKIAGMHSEEVLSTEDLMTKRPIHLRIVPEINFQIILKSSLGKKA